MSKRFLWTFELIAAESKKYETRAEFKKKNKGAYQAAQRKKILDDVCPPKLYNQHTGGYWTNERLATEAKKYKTRAEFNKNSCAAYKKSLKLGIADDICSHMDEKFFWTHEEIASTARKFSVLKDFKKEFPGAVGASKEYRMALKLGFLDKCFKPEKKDKFTKKEVTSTAKKYKNRTNFREKSRRVYNFAVKKNILNDVCAHMRQPWAEKTIRKEAKKYEKRKQFEIGSSGAYAAARRLNILDKVCSHMESSLWTEKKLQKEAKKYSEKTEFHKKASGAYAAACRLNILDKVCSHMKTNKTWDAASIFAAAKKCKSRSEFNSRFGGACNAARRLGILDDVCDHMPLLHKKNGFWTDSRIKKEAEKYKSKKEFRQKSPSAYALAVKSKIFDKVTAHMDVFQRKPWTEKELIELASEYNRIIDFKKENTGAYSAILKYNILDTIFDKSKRNASLREKEYQNRFALKIEEFLTSKNVNFLLKKELRIPQRDNDKGRVDLFLSLLDYDIIIPIEVKHDMSDYSNIKRQISKYNRSFRERKGFYGTYLVSERGRYGFSEEEFMLILEKIITNEEIYLPNSLNYFKKHRS